jgi:hypothetical protein
VVDRTAGVRQADSKESDFYAPQALAAIKARSGQSDEWMTVEEICAELKVSRRTFDRWRTTVYGAANRNLRRTAVVFAFISFFIVIALLAVSGEDIIENAFHNDPPWYAIDPIILYGPLLLILVWITRKWFMPQGGSRAQLAAVYFPASYVILAIILYSVFTSYPPQQWPKNTLNDWKAYLAVAVALFFPGIMMVVYARALPDVLETSASFWRKHARRLLAIRPVRSAESAPTAASPGVAADRLLTAEDDR